MSDTQSAEGKVYVAFLVVTDETFTRRKAEIEQVVRTISGTGLAVMGIVIQEGDSGSGTVLDSDITTFRFASQDFVVTNLSPGIDLILLERNLAVSTTGARGSTASTTVVGSDFEYTSYTLALPNPPSSVWTISAIALVNVSNSNASNPVSCRIDCSHAAGSGGGTAMADAVGTANVVVTRLSRVGLSGINGGQTVTFHVYAIQNLAGTLTMNSAVSHAIAVRTN